MFKYIVSHWRGEHTLLISFVINDLVVGFVLWVFFQTAFRSLAAFRLLDVHPFIYVTIEDSVMALWSVWANVGLLRCGVKNLCANTNTLVLKGAGAVAIALGSLGLLDTIFQLVKLMVLGMLMLDPVHT